MQAGQLEVSKRLRIEALSHADMGGMFTLNIATDSQYTRYDFLAALTAGRLIGHKTTDGQLISCGCMSLCDENIGIIGLIMVHPDYQKQGLGTALCQRLTSLLPGDNPSIQALVSDDALPLMQKFDFVKSEKLPHLTGIPQFNDFSLSSNEKAALADGASMTHVLPMRDLSKMIKLDAASFGAPRIKMIKRRFGQCDKRAFLYDSDNQLAGFILAEQVNNILVCGPLIAPDEISAFYLLKAVWEQSQKISSMEEGKAPPQYVQINIVGHSTETLQKMLFEVGLTETKANHHIWFGAKNMSKNWQNYYGLMSSYFL